MNKQTFLDWCIEKQYQNLLSEWDNEKNGDLKPDAVTSHCSRKVWWKCKNGHEWEAAVDNRTGTNKTGCPYCSGRLPIIGQTDLQSQFPSIATEWHPSKNGDIKPTDVTLYSGKRVWWLGKCGHEWMASVGERTHSNGCPYCSNHRVLQGFNDLQTKYPGLAREWSQTKNLGIKPSEVLCGSHKKAWWVCAAGHEWEAVIKSRSLGGCGCPYCSGRNVITGINDLQTINPEVAREWNHGKNGKLLPSEIAFGSNRKVWWKCSKGHEWKVAVSNRTGSKKTGCPFCTNRFALPGYNDLASKNPGIALEWNYEKNKGAKNGDGADISTPDRITAVSGIKVWWKCRYGHEWKTAVANRTNGAGCPYCSSSGTSVPEQGISFYLEQVCRVEQRRKISGLEIDVFLPEYNVGIEYDGIFYHKPIHAQKEAEKDRVLLEKGIRIIRIKEGKNNQIQNNRIIYYKTDDMRSNYDWALNQLCELLVSFTGNKRFADITINAQKDLLKIRERSDLYVKKNSLAVLFPEIAQEWNQEKNGILQPDMFTIGSDTKVWWKCSKGHEWKTTVSHRTSRGDGCPYCSQKRMLKGYNDFESWCLANGCEALLKEWDPGKNVVEPSGFSRQSKEKVWWKCNKGHEWMATISHRADGHGCPYCNGGVAKCVRNIDTGEVFPSTIEAAQKYGLKSRNSISQCCLGKCKTAGGHRWEYLS